MSIFVQTSGVVWAKSFRISALMHVDYRINSIFFPNLRDLMDPEKFRILSNRDKQIILINVGKCGLLNVIIIRIFACIVCCSIFSFNAPVGIDNEWLFLFQFLLLLQYLYGEYLNQREVLHPEWYINYGLD